MAKTTTIMTDSNGQEIPLKYVSKFDRARDKVARKILARFNDERARLIKVLKDSLVDLDSLMQLKTKLGVKGNFQTQSFDGLIQVEIRQQYNITLDERVIKARELMMEYVTSVLNKVEGVDTTVLRRLVDSAFRANSKGFLPVSKILELMRIEVKDVRWNAARGIIQEAMKPVAGKRYLNVAVRKSTQGEFRAVRLDLADCWPEEEEER